MNYFAEEAAVRAQLHLADTVSAEQIDAALAEAHAVILDWLAPEVELGDPPESIARGEALLAGAMLFRSMAAAETLRQRRLSVGGARIEESRRLESLERGAETLENRALEALGPYLRQPRPRTMLQVTSTRTW